MRLVILCMFLYFNFISTNSVRQNGKDHGKDKNSSGSKCSDNNINFTESLEDTKPNNIEEASGRRITQTNNTKIAPKALNTTEDLVENSNETLPRYLRRIHNINKDGFRNDVDDNDDDADINLNTNENKRNIGDKELNLNQEDISSSKIEQDELNTGNEAYDNINNLSKSEEILNFNNIREIREKLLDYVTKYLKDVIKDDETVVNEAKALGIDEKLTNYYDNDDDDTVDENHDNNFKLFTENALDEKFRAPKSNVEPLENGIAKEKTDTTPIKKDENLEDQGDQRYSDMLDNFYKVTMFLNSNDAINAAADFSKNWLASYALKYVADALKSNSDNEILELSSSNENILQDNNEFNTEKENTSNTAELHNIKNVNNNWTNETYQQSRKSLQDTYRKTNELSGKESDKYELSNTSEYEAKQMESIEIDSIAGDEDSSNLYEYNILYKQKHKNSTWKLHLGLKLT